jgi:predicted ATPase
MLRRVTLESFKRFPSLDLPLAPMTLLTGTNSGGKSTVIQALALLAQNFEIREWEPDLLLDGPDIALGTVADVLNQQSGGRQLKIGCAGERESVEWTFTAEDRKAMSVDLVDVAINRVHVGGLAAGPVRWLLPASTAVESEVVASLRRLTWLTAERVGPREVLPLRDPQRHRRVGPRGEYVAGLLHWFEDDQVIDELCIADEPRFLVHQVRAHMQRFFPSFDMRVAPVEGVSAITLKLRTDPRAEFHRPQNVGFGLTQLLPVIVAVVHAARGDVLVIENPEVHLHPRAQQDVGSLLCMAAAAGVQVIVESHSDHVLNGIRLSVKSSMIKPSDVALHFFSGAADGGLPVSPKIDEDGRLDSWPPGFFDQFDDALSKLL